MGWPWLVLVCAIATVPMAGAFSTSRIFYVRDLGLSFWPRHLWLRNAWNNGEWPWWDPSAAAGQAAVADALNQFFLLPVTLVRIVLPEVIGFNIWIAAPFPLMALGAWLWLRRSVSPAAACVGALIYALAGPVLSSGNFPNLSWSVASIPWVLWATDRVVRRPGIGPISVLATFLGLQAVAGDPVTFAGTAALVVAYSYVVSGLGRPLARVVAAMTFCTLLSAVQILPLVSAAFASPRVGGVNRLPWSMHPLELAETVVAHPFGNAFYAAADQLPWMFGMHGREPLFFSLYIGFGAFALSTLRWRHRDVRLRRFWWIVAAVALVCALGRYTPVYPMAQEAIPVLHAFRYPVKYLVFCVIALAALSAGGADALLAHARGRGAMTRPVIALAAVGTVASVAGVAGLLGLVYPASMLGFWEVVARAAHFDDPAAAAHWLVAPSTPLMLGVAGLGLGLVVLLTIVWRRHRWAPIAAAALCALAVLDPLVVNFDIHPTLPAAAFGPPAWIDATRSHPHDRVYVGGHIIERLDEQDGRGPKRLDLPRTFFAPLELSMHAAVAMTATQFALVPAAWGIRQSITEDLPALMPREYALMMDKLRSAPREDRFRFVERTGVRYCFVSEPPFRGARALTPPAALTASMALYECGPDARRVYVTQHARVEPDVRRRLDLMFDARHDPRSTVLLEREPPAAAGEPGGGASPEARIIRETNMELVVRASIGPDGGYLNVLDSYDRFWDVTVGDRPAVILRANGLYRAVRLAPGIHDVRFTYHPVPLYAGASLSAATALLLLSGCLIERRRLRSG